MALYDKKTIVVIDDNIYDLMEDYKHILCRKDFGVPPEKIKYIKLSDLSAAIPADRIDDFRMYFYIFEKINTAQEYEEIAAKLIKSPNVSIAVLYCQDSVCFNLCEEKKKALRYIHNIGISRDFSLEETDQLTDREVQARNCLNLSALLFYLISLEEGAFDDFTVKLQLNYPSLYSAVQYTLLEYTRDVELIEAKVKEERECIERFKAEKPHRYEYNFSANKINEQILNTPVSGDDSQQELKQLSSLYADCESEIDCAIARDVSAIRYAMAEMDQFAKGGREPEFYSNRTEVSEPVTVDDLLRNVELTEGKNLNAKQAINLARGLVTTEKPGVKPFFIAVGVSVLLFLLSIASVYLINVVKNGTVAVDMTLLIVCVLVPIAILLLAGVVGFIMNTSAYKKIKALLSGIRDSISNRTRGFDSLVENVRRYLNDFLTVFCNYHAKDFRISQCNKRIFSLEKEREAVIDDMAEYNSIADLIKILYDYEQELKAKEGEGEAYSDNLYNATDKTVDYRIDAYELNDEDRLLSEEDEEAVETQTNKGGLVRYGNCNQCLKAIEKGSKTTISGNESTAFVNSKSPWISSIEISACVNGGVL